MQAALDEPGCCSSRPAVGVAAALGAFDGGLPARFAHLMVPLCGSRALANALAHLWVCLAVRIVGVILCFRHNPVVVIVDAVAHLDAHAVLPDAKGGWGRGSHSDRGLAAGRGVSRRARTPYGTWPG